MPKIAKQTPDGRARGPTTGNPPAHRSVLDRIAPIGFDAEDGIKILLYGRSGTGKTTLSSTFPKPILWVICSGGDKPGELRSIDTADNRKQISQVVLQHSKEMLEIAEHIDSSYRETTAGFSTVVLDHASGLQDLVLKEILGLEELPAQKTWGLASQQQYGQCTLQCKELLRALLGLHCNVVIVAQEREFNTETGSELITPTVGAGLTPSLTGWLNTAVDYICQTFLRQEEIDKTTTIGQGKAAKQVTTKVKTRNVQYCLRTSPDPVYTTKFRVPKGSELPEVIVDPDYEKLMAIISGAVNNGKAE